MRKNFQWAIAMLILSIACGFVGGYLINRNEPQATGDDVVYATNQWDALDESQKNVICNMYAEVGSSRMEEIMIDEGGDEHLGAIKAKIRIMEQECNDYLR